MQLSALSDEVWNEIGDKREQIAKLARVIQSSGVTRCVTTGSLATELIRRNPSLKPESIGWADFFLIVDRILKDEGLFEGQDELLVPVRGVDGEAGAVPMSMTQIEDHIAKLRDRPHCDANIDAAFALAEFTAERSSALAKSVAAGHSTGFENAMRKQRGTHGQGVLSKMSPRQRQRYLEACDLLGECQPAVDAASVEGFVTMFSDFAKARAAQYGVRQ